jgi:hypothetical protein
MTVRIGGAKTAETREGTRQFRLESRGVGAMPTIGRRREITD